MSAVTRGRVRACHATSSSTPSTRRHVWLRRSSTRCATAAWVAYPTDSGYALACAPGNKEGLDRIRAIRQLDGKHNFTFVCADFAQVGPLAIVGNNAFRLIKRLTPGPWTFILKGTKDVPG